MNRKGVSNIIAVVLMILIVLVAIALIASVISIFIKSSSQQSAKGVNFIDLKIVGSRATIINETFVTGTLEPYILAKIRRNYYPGNLTGFRAVIENKDGNSEHIDINTTIGELEALNFQIKIPSIIENPTLLIIAPIISDEDNSYVAIPTDQAPITGPIACLRDRDCKHLDPADETTYCQENQIIFATTNYQCDDDLKICVPGITTTQVTQNCGSLYCSDISLKCVECSDDSQCAPNVCDPETYTCVECYENEQCPSGICNLETNTCGQCDEDLDCLEGYVCDVAINECVECTENSDCANGVCNLETNTCVECEDNNDCAANPDGNICNLGTNTCAECYTNSDCTNDAIECTVATCNAGICEQTPQDSLCPAFYTCDPLTGCGIDQCTIRQYNVDKEFSGSSNCPGGSLGYDENWDTNFEVSSGFCELFTNYIVPENVLNVFTEVKSQEGEGSNELSCFNPNSMIWQFIDQVGDRESINMENKTIPIECIPNQGEQLMQKFYLEGPRSRDPKFAEEQIWWNVSCDGLCYPLNPGCEEKIPGECYVHTYEVDKEIQAWSNCNTPGNAYDGNWNTEVSVSGSDTCEVHLNYTIPDKLVNAVIENRLDEGPYGNIEIFCQDTSPKWEKIIDITSINEYQNYSIPNKCLYGDKLTIKYFMDGGDRIYDVEFFESQIWWNKSCDGLCYPLNPMCEEKIPGECSLTYQDNSGIPSESIYLECVNGQYAYDGNWNTAAVTDRDRPSPNRCILYSNYTIPKNTVNAIHQMKITDGRGSSSISCYDSNSKKWRSLNVAWQNGIIDTLIPGNCLYQEKLILHYNFEEIHGGDYELYEEQIIWNITSGVDENGMCSPEIFYKTTGKLDAKSNCNNGLQAFDLKWDTYAEETSELDNMYCDVNLTYDIPQGNIIQAYSESLSGDGTGSIELRCYNEIMSNWNLVGSVGLGAGIYDNKTIPSNCLSGSELKLWYKIGDSGGGQNPKFYEEQIWWNVSLSPP